MSQPDDIANPVLSSAAVKHVYVARWHEDGKMHELRLRGEESQHLPSALAGDSNELEKTIGKEASKVGWLLTDETLQFVTATTASDGIERTSCTYLSFAFCPAKSLKGRICRLLRRSPERLAAYISLAMSLAILVQLGLLFQQNNQFDEALRNFESVVQAYLWQVNTPALDASSLPGTNDIELTNYSLTFIRISKATLVTPNGEFPLLKQGMIIWPNAKEPYRFSTLPPDIILGGDDINKGVVIEVDYNHMGNLYKLIWPAKVKFAEKSLRIEPLGEPTKTPIKKP